MSLRLPAPPATLRLLGVLLFSICAAWSHAAESGIPDRDPQVRAAREKVERVRAQRRALPGKAAKAREEAALAEYNLAVASRAERIVARVQEIEIEAARAAGMNGEATRFSRTGSVLSPERLAEDRELIAEYRTLVKTPMGAAYIAQTEGEPNDTAAQANGLDSFSGAYLVFGKITAGDVDYSSFPAPAGSRVSILTDTGGTQHAGANSRDTRIDLLGPDGATVLETDDDDGTANGLDGTVESGFASSISGHVIATAGRYFVRVRGFNATAVIDPYRLFVVVTTDNYFAAYDEAEPNGTAGSAVQIIPSAAVNAVRRTSATISPAGDLDYYAVNVQAGNILFVSADGDPGRTGTSTDLVLDLFDRNGFSSLLQADSSSAGVPGDPASEAFAFLIPTSGTYFVRVRGSGTDTGSYDLVVAVASGDPSCPSPIIAATLGLDTSDYPSFHGMQTDRVSRVLPVSECPTGKAYPGTIVGGLHAFDQYAFPNTTGDDACVTVDYDAEQCGGSLEFVSYLDSFDPSDVAANYLGDLGRSDPTGLYSVVVPAGHTLVLVVSEVTAGVGCGHYHFSVAGTGATCLKPIRLDVDTTGSGSTSSNTNGVIEPGERVRVAPRWLNSLRPRVFQENFDAAVPPALPAGWTRSVSGPGSTWITSASKSDSPPNDVVIDDPASVSDKSLFSPPIFIYSDDSNSALLTFRNSYQFEGGLGTTGFDGGVLEISINSSAYQDILEAGGSFVANGYNQTIEGVFGNPLAGRQAWSSVSPGYVTTVVNLPFSANNKNIQLRWRMGSDNSGAATGWRIDTITIGSSRAMQFLDGSASGLAGPAAGSYALNDSSAHYSDRLPGGMETDCVAVGAGDCYEMTVGGARPAQHWDASFAEQVSLSAAAPKIWKLHLGNSFADVPPASGQYKFVENVFHNGVTAGCGGGNYCPGSAITRDQMAVFLLISKEGTAYVPPPCVTPIFGDVPCSSPFAKWINELSHRGVVAGCGGGNYCPTSPVTRAQMSVFLLATKEPPGYDPPFCAEAAFADVPCSNGFGKWINELVRRGITAGCGGGNYCPATAATRGQMAVFLVTTFGLELYGP